MSKANYLAQQAFQINEAAVEGSFLSIDGDRFYRIHNYRAMPAFFMSLVSPSDHWMFIASNGGLSAGRVNAESALFPYYTDDKLIDAAEYTGSKTIIRCRQQEKNRLWEPFSDHYQGLYRLEHNIYKNTTGNRLRFEEINLDLQLRFAYEYSFSDRFGIVREAFLENLGDEKLSIELVDGLQNLLPSGVGSALQNGRSTLVDAYKMSELSEAEQLAIFSLSARIIDRAEPSEALMANVLWSSGLEARAIVLDAQCLAEFRRGRDLSSTPTVKGKKGAYFINAEIELGPKQERSWLMVAEVDRSSAQTQDLKKSLSENSTEELRSMVIASRKADQQQLKAIVGKGDGLQCCELETVSTRHYGNVLFNLMRGGLFESAYQIDRRDFLKYLNQVSLQTATKFDPSIRKWPESLSYQELLDRVMAFDDADLERVALEYLPLSFSRRHGDPSRPWNVFNIHTRDEMGERLLSYEGNWRDIFQNWEALAYSYPLYIKGMISKFLNASTVDAYNPYRISKEGIDWEVIEEDDPWSYIGYWGDHQIIYLQKLLEHWAKHEPAALESEWNKAIYTYAQVPYRIKSFAEILANPKDTIDFDHELDQEIKHDIALRGSDAKMLWKDGALVKSTLAEKLLLTAATKLYNLVPEGGIWMNTQRPEWNDANNALVGNGLSMVTLYYLRRYLNFLLQHLGRKDLEVNEALLDLIKAISASFENSKEHLQSGFDARTRFAVTEALGQAGEQYRQRAYRKDLGEKKTLSALGLSSFLSLSLGFIDQSIAANKREDGLYHAYNLLQIEAGEIKLRYLYEMLEGQVAILSADYLPPAEALNLLDKLKSSALYREDQYSYLLYPNRDLPGFLEKNNIDPGFAAGSKLLARLIERGDHSLVERDTAGHYHFAGSISNAGDLRKVMKNIENGPLAAELRQEREALLDEFERIFDHQSFTGRSGTFFAYEGLGSIYWHMVSKLLLATQENLQKAHGLAEDPELIGRLVDHYYSIRAGIGLNKNPKLYGAFPFDPYSHSPWEAGVQQPGMTGQVKEDILNRWAELGLSVKAGRICFDPFFIDTKELLAAQADFEYIDPQGQWQQTRLEAGELGFTYNGLLVRFRRKAKAALSLIGPQGTEGTWTDLILPTDLSEQIFKRNHNYKELVLEFPFE